MRFLSALFICLPVAGFSAGSDDTAPPEPPKCYLGQVLDVQGNRCVNADHSALDDDERYAALRAYAYEEDFDAANLVMDAMADQSGDGVLTYRGYVARKTGDPEGAMSWYSKALMQNPDNLLARSYMGQALVLMGKTEEAQQQLNEINARGGTGTWAETSLAKAIETGETYSY